MLRAFPAPRWRIVLSPPGVRVGIRQVRPAHPQAKTKGCCVASWQRPACVPYELKIRKASGAPGWLLPICQACFAAVMPLNPVAELLWFQSMGVDGGSARLQGAPPALG